MARKTKEDAQQTRELLLNSAEKLFSENGVANTSLQEIALAAGLTRGAIYWHFQNKHDLINALWDRVKLPLEAAFEKVEKSCTLSPLARIQMRSSTVLKNMANDPAMRNLATILLLKCEYTEKSDNMRSMFLMRRYECMSMITEDFKAAIAAGELPAALDVHFAAIGLISVIDGLCFHWLMNPANFALEQKADSYINTYLQGLKAL